MIGNTAMNEGVGDGNEVSVIWVNRFREELNSKEIYLSFESCSEGRP
jgi:hypothetical protein